MSDFGGEERISIFGSAENHHGDRSCGQGTDLGQVVGGHTVSGPDPGALGAVDAGAVPAVSAFEVANSSFAAGSPFDGAAEGFSVFDGASRLRGFAFTRDDHVGDAEVGELAVEGCFAVAAVGGYRARRAPGALGHPFDRRSQLARIGRIAPLHTVIQHDSVVIVDDLALVPELDRLTETPFADRAGIAVVQADPPTRPVRGDPSDP